MITEGYFAKIKDYPETDVLICVARKYPWFVKKGLMEHCRSLAPTPDLLKDWKNGDIIWDEYIERFNFDMCAYTQPLRQFRYYGDMAKRKVVRFMCWEKAEDKQCHRFILLGIFKNRGSSGSAKDV